jgi:alpha-galactosidase
MSFSQPDYEILKKTCNLWRNWKDIEDSWESVLFISDYFAENQARIAPHAGNGHWNDPDTLLLGNYGLSYDQSKAQLAVWAILAAPFLISTDIRTMKPEIKELLLNRDIIAIDQDALGIQGIQVNKGNGVEVWAKKVLPKVGDHYSYAVAFVSRRTDGHPHAFDVTLKDLQLDNKFGYQVKVKI